MAYQVSYNSPGVRLFPQSAAVVYMNAWMLYGRVAGDSNVMLWNACNLAFTTFKATMRCASSRDTEIGWGLVLALALMYIASPMMTVAQHGYTASIWTVICYLSPILRIRRKILLPNFAVWMLATGGVRTLYGLLAWDMWILLSHFVGVLFATAELILAVWMW